ncbi:MAG: helix-turn-helix domain-containing protein [Candidatus Chryseobacterium colombiense]|nr:helix-turn-helix domain-containing protein [Chryseobacterium sp.]WEK71173.1 MAG: helix-turn-helix domain-containing protein [Chryseobacterium sp.]
MSNYSIEPFLFPNGNLNINTKSIAELLEDRPQIIEPHKLSFFALHLFEKGEGLHMVDFNKIEVKEKHILFVAQNQINQFFPPVNYGAKILIFTKEFFCLNQMHLGFFHNTCLFNDPAILPYFDLGNRYDDVLLLFNLIEAELKNCDNENQHIILNNHLFSLLLICENIFRPDSSNTVDISPRKILISKFKTFVNSNDLNKSLSVKQIASYLNVNVRTLEKAFKELEETTPYVWMNNRLILEIKRLLVYKTFSFL